MTSSRSNPTLKRQIRQVPVPAAFPPDGPVDTIIYGEAPGPRGADQSGVPFAGDLAGPLLYRVLLETGRCTFPRPFDDIPWDGVSIRELKLWPTFIRTALSNAYPICPTLDGHSFHAPTRSQLMSVENRARLAHEIATARACGLVRVVTLGRVSRLLLGTDMSLASDRTIAFVPLPHPSPQGLLQMAPNKGKGMKRAELVELWSERFRAALLTVPGDTDVRAT